MSDNPSVVVERQAFRHCRLFCDALSNVVFIPWIGRRCCRFAPAHGSSSAPATACVARHIHPSWLTPSGVVERGRSPQSIPPNAVAQAGQKDHRGFNTVGKSGECRANGCGRLRLLVCGLAFLLSKRCKSSPA